GRPAAGCGRSTRSGARAWSVGRVAAEAAVPGHLLGRERLARDDVRPEVRGAEAALHLPEVGRHPVDGLVRGTALREEGVEVTLDLDDLRAESAGLLQHRRPDGFDGLPLRLGEPEVV